MKQVPTLRLSHDFLESFFGRCRALNGYNNNPTRDQFTCAFRKLLVNSELRSSSFSNCVDRLSILTISSKKNSNEEEPTEPNNNEKDFDDYSANLDKMSSNDYLLDIFQLSTIAFNAGSIEAKVLKENILIDFDLLKTHRNMVPCKSTVDICIAVSKYAKIFQNRRDLKFHSLVYAILQNIDFDSLYLYTNSSEHQDGHMLYLVKFIIEESLRLNFTSVARTVIIANQRVFLRNKLKNIVKNLGL